MGRILSDWRYGQEIRLGLFLGLAALLGALFYLKGFDQNELPEDETTSPIKVVQPAQITELAHGLLFPEPRPLQWPELQLFTGGPVTPELFQGRWTLLFFGYTSCPDVCPTTLGVLKQLLAELDNAGLTAPQILFISVDPQRDSLERLSQYLPWFGTEFLGARAEPQALDNLAHQLSQPYLLIPNDGAGNYSVAHSARLMLIDPHGDYAGYLYSANAVEPLLQSLQSLLKPLD